MPWSTLGGRLAAFALGAAIGFERQVRQRRAGLRTNTLVAVGAAIFVDMASRRNANAGAVQVVAYVVSGVGFLGPGVIIREEGNVRGIDTAATLWGSAAAGACAGAHLFVAAVLGAGFVLAANTLLRPVVNALHRRPSDEPSAEFTPSIFVMTARDQQKSARESLQQAPEAARYRIGELALHVFGPNEIQIEAKLLSTSVDPQELDRLVADRAQRSFVTQAFWTPRLSD